MEKITFKKIVSKCLKEAGFYRYKTWYCLDTNELFIGVKVDRSQFSETYYIDYGIFVKSRYNNDDYKQKSPYYAEIGSRIDACEIENCDESIYESILSQHIKDIFLPLKLYGEIALK